MMRLIGLLIGIISFLGLYPTTGIVTEVNVESDVVVFETQTGISHEIYGVEDWMEGDIVSAIMWNNSTAEVFDDVVLSVRYCGYEGE